MTAVWFLGVAVAVSVIGSVVVLMRHRAATKQPDGIDQFAQVLRALAPDDPDLRAGR